MAAVPSSSLFCDNSYQVWSQTHTKSHLPSACNNKRPWQVLHLLPCVPPIHLQMASMPCLSNTEPAPNQIFHSGRTSVKNHSAHGETQQALKSNSKSFFWRRFLTWLRQLPCFFLRPQKLLAVLYNKLKNLADNHTEASLTSQLRPLSNNREWQ